MSTSKEDVAYAEAKFGKDSPTVQLLRNSRMGEGQTARDLYVTGRTRPIRDEVETAEEGSQDDT